MTAHAKLGPSACSRWSTCTASVALIDRLKASGAVPQNSSSTFADEGTAAHEVRETCLRYGFDPQGLVGMKIEVNGAFYEVTEEMAEYLTEGIDWIREHTSEPDVEIRVDLSPWLPGQFGTMDGGWISSDGETIVATDLKYGAGVPVSAERNKQQMLYALGYWHFKGRPPVKRVLVNIDQPRAGGMKFWECPLDELLAFGDEMAEVYKKIASGDTVFAPSPDACKWCDAAKPVPAAAYMGCDALNAQQIDIFGDAFDDLDADEPQFDDPDTLTPARRYYIVKHAKAAAKWLAELHSASMEAAMMGTPDPGSKAVIGQRGNRYFTDPEKAEEIMTAAVGDAAYRPKQIVGITDAEKLLKPGRKKPGHPEAWEALNALVDQPEGKPILVPEDDNRPAISLYEFDDLPDDGNAVQITISDSDFDDL